MARLQGAVLGLTGVGYNLIHRPRIAPSARRRPFVGIAQRVSKFHLHRLFSSYTGMGVAQVIRELRLRQRPRALSAEAGHGSYWRQMVPAIAPLLSGGGETLPKQRERRPLLELLGEFVCRPLGVLALPQTGSRLDAGGDFGECFF